jgi:nuclear transport factor 2 (NTF2) superfamily protein
MPSPTDIRPPFTFDTASAKVRAAEDAWNSRDPHRVSLGLMRRREASINDVRIAEDKRKFHWAAPGPRPTSDTGIPSVQ